jgi:phosphohistidine phosphatase SixA
VCARLDIMRAQQMWSCAQNVCTNALLVLMAQIAHPVTPIESLHLIANAKSSTMMTVPHQPVLVATIVALLVQIVRLALLVIKLLRESPLVHLIIAFAKKDFII